VHEVQVQQEMRLKGLQRNSCREDNVFAMRKAVI
jgi:hypothetical protein